MSGMSAYDYDLFVIGSGPAGQRAAIQAAKLDRRVGLAEKKTVVGGVSINTGTIPSKTLREAVLYLSGYRERNIYGASYQVKQKITMQDLLFRTESVIKHEIDVIRHQLQRNGVDLLPATASFVDAHTIRLDMAVGHGSQTVTAEKIVIAAGTEATKDPHIPFDGRTIFTSDDVVWLDRLPKSLIVVGAGVVGLDTLRCSPHSAYASPSSTSGRVCWVSSTAKSSTTLSTISARTASRCGWVRK